VQVSEVPVCLGIIKVVIFNILFFYETSVRLYVLNIEGKKKLTSVPVNMPHVSILFLVLGSAIDKNLLCNPFGNIIFLNGSPLSVEATCALVMHIQLLVTMQ
jgi:hypothetical protein